MATATARVPVLMTKTEKARITKKARQAGLSTGEYMRRAAASFNLPEEDKVLLGMIDQMIKATQKAERAIEEALDFVSASNRRIAAIEAERKAS